MRLILQKKLLIFIHGVKWQDLLEQAAKQTRLQLELLQTHTGKDGIAVCGYHGWHDWYLSSNLSNKESLNNHLMSNLPIKGVPRNLKNSVFSFEYNDFKALKK